MNTQYLEQPYLDFMRHVYENGEVKEDRTGTGTRSVFGYQMRFDLNRGFPLLTTKKVHTKSIVHELIWFLAGDTNIKYLQDNGVSIWDEWADENGNLGPVYGYQWRSWPGEIESRVVGKTDWAKLQFVKDEPTYPYSNSVLRQQGIDQITNVINQIRNSPDSRRMIVSAWNPSQVDQMKLPPCHALFQFYTRKIKQEQRIEIFNQRFGEMAAVVIEREGGIENAMTVHQIPTRFLDCQLYQRSADIFLGVCFNIASYSLLVHMIAQQVNMMPGEFVWTGGDCHIYSNHFEQVELQLSRTPKEEVPQLRLRKADSVFDYKIEDFEILNYDPHPAIKAPVAV